MKGGEGRVEKGRKVNGGGDRETGVGDGEGEGRGRVAPSQCLAPRTIFLAPALCKAHIGLPISVN